MSTERNHKSLGFLSGKETFNVDSKSTGFTVHDFWRFQFSNLWDMQGEVGEFVVSMALGNTEPDNKCGWTQYDIDYRGKRIEVKTTAYYQPWKKEGQPVSQQRTFSIRKAHEDEEDMNSPLVRNNDVYVFCLILGETQEDSNPLVLEHWEFYVIPTSVINQECGDNKSISLSKVKKLLKKISGSDAGLPFGKVKEVVDKAIDDMNERFTDIEGSVITKKDGTQWEFKNGVMVQIK